MLKKSKKSRWGGSSTSSTSTVYSPLETPFGGTSSVATVFEDLGTGTDFDRTGVRRAEDASEEASENEERENDEGSEERTTSTSFESSFESESEDDASCYSEVRTTIETAELE